MGPAVKRTSVRSGHRVPPRPVPVPPRRKGKSMPGLALARDMRRDRAGSAGGVVADPHQCAAARGRRGSAVRADRARPGPLHVDGRHRPADRDRGHRLAHCGAVAGIHGQGLALLPAGGPAVGRDRAQLRPLDREQHRLRPADRGRPGAEPAAAGAVQGGALHDPLHHGRPRRPGHQRADRAGDIRPGDQPATRCPARHRHKPADRAAQRREMPGNSPSSTSRSRPIRRPCRPPPGRPTRRTGSTFAN